MDGGSGSNGGKSSGGSDKVPFTPHDIFRVGVRPPPFWPEEPAVWFSQLEGNFILSGIKDDDTKFYYVTSTLDQRYAAEIKDIIVTPPKQGKYEKLKSELIKRLSASRQKEVKQLLMHEELGDRRPSQFLRHLQRLAGPNIPDDFIKTIWTSRLPTAIQPIIVAKETTNLSTLADLADSLHELVPITPQVAATSFTPGSALEKMAKEIHELKKELKALSLRKHQPRSRSRRRDREHSSSRSQSSYRKFPVCWYHNKFGSKAKACAKPCDYKQGNDSGSR